MFRKIMLALAVTVASPVVTAQGAAAQQSAAAAQVSGRWLGESKDPRSGNVTQTMFEFKADGGTLTGVQYAGGGPPMDIRNGSIAGSKLSFQMTRNTSCCGEVTQQFTGELKGDELTLVREVASTNGAAGGGSAPIPPLVLKRVTQ